ncbi:hypothetical protein T492DRAFT_892197 [Pavlovales sp. CCMP2436]|nr:hypothetical protein T492DRAFT_892197 [Pavlovales sp. CCMP2436]
MITARAPLVLLALCFLATCMAASVPSLRAVRRAPSRVAMVIGRREFATLGAAAGSLALLGSEVLPAAAATGDQTVFVAGATGKTGLLVCRLLCEKGSATVVAGVRSESKARNTGLLCTSLAHLDVTESVEQIAESLKGCGSVVCALGFVPGNPLKFASAAHEIDNVGTVKLSERPPSPSIGPSCWRWQRRWLP